ncbi:unnamed protein product [Urochloa humidicola]
MDHQPRLHPVILLLPFVSLLAQCPGSHGTPALPPTYDASMCVDSPSSFWCGGVEIHYPFYLANSTAYHGAAPSFSCGYTDLKIACQDNGTTTETPIIQLGQDSYTVQAIFYNNNSLLLADTDVLSGNGGGCPRIRRNVSFDDAWLHLRSNTSSSHDSNLTFFFGCYPKLGGGGADPGGVPALGFDTAEKHRISCGEFSNNPPGAGDSFLFAADELDKAQEYVLAAHCEEVATVPVRSEVLADLVASGDPSVLAKGGYGDVIRQGFELVWSRNTTGQCYRCESSGGRCAYGYDKAFVGCLCNGEVGEPYCKNGSYTRQVSHHPILDPYIHRSFFDHETRRTCAQ